MTDLIRQKVQRLRSEHYRPRVLDLFAGCGGLSLGFHTAGFDITAAVEIDSAAARTHAQNLYRECSQEVILRHGISRDITKIEPEELVSEFDLGDPEQAVDVVIGGPPCQAYARIGRAKLREIADHPQAFKVDPRANLYLRYLHYIARLKPLAILMENVPDIMNFGGHNVAQEISDALSDLGYVARYSLINSVHYGVPQIRDRVFIVAYRKELHTQISFPMVTNHCELPQGYKSMRAVALKFVDLVNGQTYLGPNESDTHLPRAVSAKQALGDLPPIMLHWTNEQRRGAQRFDTLAPYRRIRPSNYARRMRSWPGFENNYGVYDHVMRRLPRDSSIFRKMEPGSEYPAALQVANALFEAEAKKVKIDRHSESWHQLRAARVPPYDPGKFPNRWWKLKAEEPVRTLTAHIGKDTYTHIHYDSSQGRVISVREAARLQSFPDGFSFFGSMNAAYRQIGNAVPPLMAMHLAEAIHDELRRTACSMASHFVPEAAE